MKGFEGRPATDTVEDYLSDYFDFSTLEAMPKAVFNTFIGDRTMTYFNAYGNFTSAECPTFNKPNWLVYLMMYT
jgi:hypothetical protein